MLGAIDRSQLNSHLLHGFEMEKRWTVVSEGYYEWQLGHFAGSHRLNDMEFRQLSGAEIQHFQQWPIFIYLNFEPFKQAPCSKPLRLLN